MYAKILSTTLAALLIALPLPGAAVGGGLTIDVKNADSVAGIKTLVVLKTKEPETRVSVNVFMPNGSKILYSRASDSAGKVELRIDGRNLTQAGRYKIKAYDGKGNSASETFKVFADVPAEVLLTLLDDSLTVDRKSFVRIEVADQYGNVLDRPVLAVAGNAIVQREEDEGENIFSVIPEDGGPLEITVVDLLSEEPMELFALDVEGSSGPGGNTLRASLLDEYEREEEGGGRERGRRFVDRFAVELLGDDGSPTQVVRVNEPYSVLVTAVDGEGGTVRDYTGEVVFDATDTLAELPAGAVKFYASDRGEIELPLAVMFGAPGRQALFVEEKDDPGIMGEIALRVTGSSGAVDRGRIVITSPADGAVAGGSAVSIAGIAPAFVNLDLLDNGAIVGAGSSRGDGSFSFTVSLDSAVPAHEIVVREGEGGLGRESQPVSLSIDMEAPDVEEVVLLPSVLLPGAPFTVSVTAEPGEEAEARIGSDDSAALPEGEAGVYGGTMTAPIVPGSHTVTVTVRDSAGNEAEISALLTVESSGLPVVTGLTAQPIDQDILLSWEPVPGAAQYRIYFGSSPADLSRHVDSGSAASSARLTGLTGGRMIHFAVTAVDAVGRESGEKSAIVFALPRGSLYQVVLIPRADGAAMRWTPLPGSRVTLYRIEYGVEPGFYTEVRHVAPAQTHYDLVDLIGAVTYYVRLSTVNEDGTVTADPVESTVTPVPTHAAHGG